MRKIIQILLLIFVLSPLAVAQTPVRIHDLKSLTDSSGTDHLFYRIYAEYEGTEYGTDNIYHYNIASGQEELFLEDFYDTRFGFPFSQAVTDYAFLENDPENYVYITSYCDNECSQTISRPSFPDLMGGLFVTIDNLNIEGTDTGRVYVEAYGETIIGENGGRDWPDVNVETWEIPDSSVLDFPLVSLSPYNDSLMFGRKYFFSDNENALLKSIKRGDEIEVLSDTLLPSKVYFDKDGQTIYLIDRVNAPGDQCTFQTCKYAIYKNHNLGGKENWEIIFISETEVKFFNHPTSPGQVYFWVNNEIFISMDYGENFESFIGDLQEITSFTVTPNRAYYSTISGIYELKDGIKTEVTSIPVSNEHIPMIPKITELHQNYPNPFNPTTTITYTMREAGQVNIGLYSIQGQLVQELINDYKLEGQHSFMLNGSTLASGVYILRGRLGAYTQSKTITLIK